LVVGIWSLGIQSPCPFKLNIRLHKKVCLQQIQYSLFQILVVWVTISDWPCVLVNISLNSPHGTSKNVPGCSLGRIPWNLLWHTQQQDGDILVLDLQNKFRWCHQSRDCSVNLCLSINQRRYLLSQRALAHVAKTWSFHKVSILVPFWKLCSKFEQINFNQSYRIPPSKNHKEFSQHVLLRFQFWFN